MLYGVRSGIFFFFQAEDGIRDLYVTGVQTCALPISCRLTHVIGRGVPIRSGDAHARIPPVPESGSKMVDAHPIERAIALEAAGHMPSLATDIVDQFCRGVPTVELDINRPAFGQERT